MRKRVADMTPDEVERYRDRERRRLLIIAWTTCPKCLAPKGSPCRGMRGGRYRRSLHRARWSCDGVDNA
jgi:hypothetical protein